MLTFVLDHLPKDENSCMSPEGITQLLEIISNGFVQAKKYISTHIFVSPIYFDFWKKSNDIEKLDFKAENAVDVINLWVKNATEGKIVNLYDKIPEEIKAAVVNVVYFKAMWKTPFNDSFFLPFFLTPDCKIEVETMVCDGLFMVSDDLTTIRLPYKDSEAVMIIFMNEITPEKSMTFKFIRLTMPKFTFEKEYILSDALSNALSIDLKVFTPTRDNNLFLTEIKQKTHIKVDENGTEAAVATSCLVSDCIGVLPDYTVKVNKPFMYLIKENENILFVGKCIDPRVN
ncbi:hypothetical protein KM759_gp021 [Lymphocystis disease virus 4]|uniref:Serpin domain-containing protein n=1 Tax=Lymphocystis disease virus 4 TaxID=2704413 RepID=A0A6B9XL91_9VIRU|nr:hypothetical protein KM759_gp021 [Lymphocystis disease virus 4]QHR78494.1 hypothetical protein [Lymphocystis disease virus 4]